MPTPVLGSYLAIAAVPYASVLLPLRCWLPHCPVCICATEDLRHVPMFLDAPRSDPELRQRPCNSPFISPRFPPNLHSSSAEKLVGLQSEVQRPLHIAVCRVQLFWCPAWHLPAFARRACWLSHFQFEHCVRSAKLLCANLPVTAASSICWQLLRHTCRALSAQSSLTGRAVCSQLPPVTCSGAEASELIV